MKISNALNAITVVGIMAGSIAFAQTTTLQGVVGNTFCGLKMEHMGRQAADKAKCTRECVKKGSSYALIVGKKVYTLKGHSPELYKLAGQEAVVKGDLSGMTMKVSSITAAE